MLILKSEEKNTTARQFCLYVCLCCVSLSIVRIFHFLFCFLAYIVLCCVCLTNVVRILPQDPGQTEEVQSESLGWTGQKLETKDSQVCTLFCTRCLLMPVLIFVQE